MSGPTFRMNQLAYDYVVKIFGISDVTLFTEHMNDVALEFKRGWGVASAFDRKLDNLAVQSMERRYSPGFKRGD